MKINLPWFFSDESTSDYFQVKDSTGQVIFDDGSAYGEYSQECSRERAEYIIKAVEFYEANKLKEKE